jgi:hypoxanthine phosphoribosyltransferase
MVDSSGSAGLAEGAGVRRIVYSADDIARRVDQLGREITEHYPAAENLLVVGILKGTFIFVGDLVRRIARPVQIDFLVASSYGRGTKSSGEVRLLYDPETPLFDRHVILVEDIVDSGTTLNQLVPRLMERKPRSLQLCALLHKHVATNLALEPRWVGFDAPDEFFIGYGLDHDEDYRHLPFIGSL